MPIAAAIAGAAVIGGAVSISAASKAAKTAKNAAAASNALQAQQLTDSKALLSPYVAAGNTATPVIQGLLGLGDSTQAKAAYDTYQGSTEYQSRLQQGQNSVQSALGSRGMIDSGAAQKSLVKFGQSFASNEFGNYLGNLQGQQALGFQAAGAQTNLGANYANSVSANNNNAANIQATAAMSNAATINSSLNSLVGAYGLSQGLGSSYGGSKSGALGGGTGNLGFNPSSFLTKYGVGF
ncbi:hypothetical protein [Sphingomonas sp. OK281]|uniref:hypothetical protein n=1 Tax=Sphingomonas sp. OK281 TaxID=1881067 RepID=UPI0008EA6AE5|nr:hypothetical protein [Sphingomonas sp. OK281]SFO02246.1 hypothetical protein SAMN05428984_1677 [Sphingomonas sp. OK281]